ncbi:uncharacterized protein EV422DRAFT_262243 [Fimicolochytrium jonesii]|uniref:uncharacterized protein n=1 Tax=Fimicolochytrium jonesii TaxID=1396493 RepID=UPI0022FEAFAD|nr:uncharacterized protein EV422DRAFT_262243 [Fimicolochytrium jonesii]KAI8817038.1 hypothetical protein EV422DRAFT_262243 [Fimicolochytrium jonesii]
MDKPKLVASGVWLFEPTSGSDELTSSTKDATKSPIRAVLIFGWMDGTLRQLQRYVHWYLTSKQLPVVLVLSQQKDWLQSRSTTIRVNEAVVSALEKSDIRVREHSSVATAGEDGDGHRDTAVFIHIFSDGGARAWTQFTDYVQKVSNGKGIPTGGIVLDSCPGRFTVSTAAAAFAAPIRNPFMRIAYLAFLYLGLTATKLYHSLPFAPADFSQLSQKALLDPARFGVHRSVRTPCKTTPPLPPPPPRLYQYSEADQMVLYRAIESSAVMASRLHPDAHVVTKNWKNTPHVRHMLRDPPLYWGLVENLFMEAMQYRRRMFR